MQSKEGAKPFTTFFMTPEQAQKHLYLSEPDSRLKLGVTVFNKETGETKIIINSNLPPQIQQVILEHERVQCEIILNYVERNPKNNIEDIMPYAHYAGLDAGVALAKRMGVLNDYLKIRGLSETEESIRSAPRP